MLEADEKNLISFLKKTTKDLNDDETNLNKNDFKNEILDLKQPSYLLSDLNELLNNINNLLNNPVIEKIFLKDIEKKERLNNNTLQLENKENILNVNNENIKKEKAEALYNDIKIFFENIIKNKPDATISEFLEDFKKEKEKIINLLISKI